MIAIITRGESFAGAIDYVQKKAVNERVLASSLGAYGEDGPTQQEVVDHMNVVTSVREAAKPVVHMSIRLGPREELTEQQWLFVIDRVRTEMGFEDCPWAAYLHPHDEQGRQHLHLVLSRVSIDGRIVSDRNDFFRAMDVMRGLEVELGLEPVVSRERSTPRGNPRSPEAQAREREFALLRAQIDAAAARSRTVGGLVERLEAQGVRVHLKVSRNGHLQGVSLQLGDSERIWKGSELGRSYSIGRLIERFELAQEGDSLRVHEVTGRELRRLRSLGLDPDRIDPSEGKRYSVFWRLIGNPSEQDAYQRLIHKALPGRPCERTEGGSDWSREVPDSVLEARRQQVEAFLAARGRWSAPSPVASLAEGLQGLREVTRQVEGLLESYARDLRRGESADRLSATWLEILRLTGVRGARPEALDQRGLGQRLAGLGGAAQSPLAVRARLLRGERGYVSAPAVAGELTYFPPHLLDSARGREHQNYNRRANRILAEREAVGLLRLGDRLGRSREDRELRERLEARLVDLERASVAWGGRRSGRRLEARERTGNAQAVRRQVSRRLAGRLRQAERNLARGLWRIASSLVPRRYVPGLGLLAKANAFAANVNAVAGWAEEIGHAVLMIEAAVRREQSFVSRRGASHLEQVASGDISTYRLLRLTSGHPKALAHFETPEGPAKDVTSAIREYRVSRAELLRFARASVREARPQREAGAGAAERAAALLAARERLVNAGLERLGAPTLRMLAGTARDRTEVLARFARGCRTAGMSVGTVARMVVEVGPVVLGGFLAGAAVTLASRLVTQQVFGLGRNLAREFLFGDRDRSQAR
jgi:relaxase-like protein